MPYVFTVTSHTSYDYRQKRSQREMSRAAQPKRKDNIKGHRK